MAAPLGYGINGTMALHAIADGRLDITPMITGRVSLGSVAGAFSSLENQMSMPKSLSLLIDVESISNGQLFQGYLKELPYKKKIISPRILKLLFK